MLDLIRFNLLNWCYEIWNWFVVESIDFMRFLNFVDIVRISSQHIRFHQFHQVPLLCDHRALACTPKDQPRRIDINERSPISFYKKILSYRQNRLKTYSCGTVWKPHMCSYILIKWIVWIECVLGQLRLEGWGNHRGATRGTLLSGLHAPLL